LAFTEEVRLEIMFFGLVDHRISENLRQLSICRSLAKGRFNVHFVVGKKTVTQFAVGGEAYSITGGAEVVTDWTYDTDHACPIPPAEMTSRTVGVRGSHLFQRAHPAQFCQDLISAEVMPVGPLAVVVEAHELDKTNVIRAVKAQLREIQNLVIIDSPHYHYIDFYWIEPNTLGSLNAAPDPIELITTGNAKKFLTLEGVQTNIDAADTGSVKVLSEFFQ
jgi:hypothetical protein